MNLISFATFIAVFAVILLATNALIAMLLMRYLSRDNTDLPIKVNRIANLASYLMLIYLAALSGMAILLAFLAH
jgi:hypothetical protein